MATSNSTDETFIPECEVFYEGLLPSGSNSLCEKNPGHSNFFSLSDLKMKDIPSEIQSKETLEYIRHYSQIVVKISVAYTSNSRPDAWPGTDKPYPYNHFKGLRSVTRTGTGYMVPDSSIKNFVRDPCPCRQCDTCGKRKDKYWRIRVFTARHVVFDGLEAKNTTCELFYLSQDKKRVQEIFGMELIVPIQEKEVNDDSCLFFCVTHDKNIVAQLEKEYERLQDFRWKNSAMMISHPHGLHQQITFGNILHVTVVKRSLDGDTVTCVSKEKHVKCRLPPFPWSIYNNEGSRDPDDYVIDNDVTMTPGTTFSAPLCKMTPPHNAKYLCSIDFAGYTLAHTFPPGTEFYCQSQQKMFFPPEAEFLFDDYLLYKNGDAEADVDEYITYDIPTCRGSSGAPIHIPNLVFVDSKRVHSGAMREGFNRSTNYKWDEVDHLMLQRYRRSGKCLKDSPPSCSIL